MLGKRACHTSVSYVRGASEVTVSRGRTRRTGAVFEAVAVRVLASRLPPV